MKTDESQTTKTGTVREAITYFVRMSFKPFDVSDARDDYQLEIHKNRQIGFEITIERKHQEDLIATVDADIQVFKTLFGADVTRQDISEAFSEILHHQEVWKPWKKRLPGAHWLHFKPTDNYWGMVELLAEQESISSVSAKNLFLISYVMAGYLVNLAENCEQAGHVAPALERFIKKHRLLTREEAGRKLEALNPFGEVYL
ncbi:hypothetical protein [Endozoicomonas sp. SESOKO4]|uniref:hypothetical protein n=1 Tax=Endozoicomonas sp. SESOKO4 TaxID=2828745 RepID=UPI0021477923|nr:hypothetical protein [Endozoicomonas sp. SESOKO4]